MADDIDIWSRWRANARQHNDPTDRFTELWTEMVRAYRAHLDSLQVPGYSHGLVRAYCLVTGDDSTSVYRMLMNAAEELVPS